MSTSIWMIYLFWMYFIWMSWLMEVFDIDLIGYSNSNYKFDLNEFDQYRNLILAELIGTTELSQWILSIEVFHIDIPIRIRNFIWMNLANWSDIDRTYWNYWFGPMIETLIHIRNFIRMYFINKGISYWSNLLELLNWAKNWNSDSYYKFYLDVFANGRILYWQNLFKLIWLI